MRIKDLIEEIKKRKDLRDVVHHEVIPPLKPSHASPKKPLRNEITEALARAGITSLYSHQADGIDRVRDGKNIVIMTPTASGKSLIYNIPVIESLLEDPESKALYLFPLKGLEQDQLRALRELTSELPVKRPDEGPPKKRKAFVPGLAEIYDGDTPDYRRKKIRERPPSVILTNPDMLHLAINAFHQKWEGFLRNLKFVIIDEVHTYRGVFGSHVAHVLRRLRRILERYGSNPVFIASSATIANPGELAETLAGLPFEVIDESGAPRGERNFVFINPPLDASPYTLSTKLFISSVEAGFKTIAFTKARKITELMHSWVKEMAPEISPSVSSYRAGFLPEERREIEGRLFRGEMNGVISTSALELGVDIGGLDVCVLVGYPGTISATLQRSGRAGRGSRDSLIVLVALPDALDQYFMRNPSDFFSRSSEAAVLDMGNRTITKAHLLCAATEAFLRKGDAFYDTERFADELKELDNEKKLRFWSKGGIWYPRKRFPQREVSIREAGDTYLILGSGGSPIGESSSTRVLYDLYPGAIYLHRGVQWKVTSLDMIEKKVFCRTAEDARYYTKAISNEETEIISVDAKKKAGSVTVNAGGLKVTETVTGFRKKEYHTGRVIGEVPLELPPSVFATKGIWMEVEDDLRLEIRDAGFGWAGSLHALEHSMIATLPLFALCDRMDLGGRSYTLNPELNGAGVFIYDGHEGGVGLTKRGFECMEAWLTATLKIMASCPCEISCPSCTQDPNCGNNNEPLDKRGAMLILKRWLGKGRL